jgi:threonine dehydrogenase-like Zn-dependent dehydrogenase
MGSEAWKQRLNASASEILGRVGHTNRMKDEAKREAWWWLQARGEALRRHRGLLRGSGILWSRLGFAELVPIEVPLPGSDEVTVEMVATAVSPGTERAQLLRLPNACTGGPHRPGYSGAGRVIATGSAVTDLAAGQLVAVYDARHASVATVAASKAFPVPEGVRAGDAAFVKLAIISGQGVRRARLEPGESVCLIGTGLVGTLAQRIALASGCGPLTVVARSTRKEAVARAGGADRFLLADADRDEIEALGAAVVIDATGDPDTLNLAIAAAGQGGRVVQLGSPRGDTEGLDLATVCEKSIELIGGHLEALTYAQRLDGVDGHAREARAFLDGLARGQLNTNGLVTRVVSPYEAASFYSDLARDSDVIGAIFDWSVLPAGERAYRSPVLGLPDITGRGVEADRKPLAPRRSPSATDRNPFAGAEGRLRFGLLGCGDIAVDNAAAISLAPNAELVASYDPVTPLAQDIASVHGGVVLKSAEALVEHPDVDAVFVSVPHHLHSPLASLAAGAGRHVIVEKPPANNLHALLEMIATADQAGVELSFCFPQRYQPSAAVMKELLDEGAIGRFGGMFAPLLQERSPA